MRQRRISKGKAEIIYEDDVVNEFGFSGTVRLIRFKRRYYTVYSRSFAVAGKSIRYDTALKMKHYTFMDWNYFVDMAAE
jgi:hypothetical protein